MRILLHDYVGHPFQVQLSRGLARRGHEVLHVYSASTLTPRGELTKRDDDPVSFDISSISLARQIPKYNFFTRYKMESEYAAKLARLVAEHRPDVVMSANSPTVVQQRLVKQCRRQGVRLVSWVQDLYGVAAHRILSKKLPGIGHLVGRYFMWLDRRSYQQSDANVVITEDFESLLIGWGVPAERVHTIHNWAPLESLPQRPRENDWSRAQGLLSGLRFVYSGTLSIRHNPNLLLQLAKKIAPLQNAEVVVISQGSGIEWLREESSKQGVTNIRFLGFQPFKEMAEVFGAGDVLVAILEPDSGIFCVPSKVLSYMCAGRPLLLAISHDNLSARIVEQSESGLVADPENIEEFLTAAGRLCQDDALRQSLGQNARRYADDHFDFETICDRFENILVGRVSVAGLA